MKKLLLLFTFSCVAMQGPSTIATFTLTEYFGTSHQDQPVAFNARTIRMQPSTHRLLGPSGTEVAWQQLSDGKIIIRSRLPRSQTPMYCLVAQMQSGEIRLNPNTCSYQNVYIGDAVAFISDDAVPTGQSCTPTTPCYVKDLGSVNMSITISATQGGAAITGMGTGSGAIAIIRLGPIQDPEDASGDSLYFHNNSYQDGDRIDPSTTGAFPTGLICGGGLYYAVSNTASTYKVACTPSGPPLNLTASTGSGLHSVKTSWTWTAQVGAATTVTPTNPVTFTVVGNNYEVQNPLTGMRIPTPASWASPLAPIQGVKLHDGTWGGAPTTVKMYEDINGSTEHTGLTSYTVRPIEVGPMYTKLQASYITNRPEYLGANATITAVDTVNDTVTLSGPGTNCNLYNQPGVSGYYRPNGSQPSPISTSSLYTLTAVSTCVFHVYLSGSLVDLTTSTTGGLLKQVIKPAGTGYFKESITLYANQPSAIIYDEYDTIFQYYLNFEPTITPDHLRGTTSSTGSIDCWYQGFGDVATATLSGGVLTVNIAIADPRLNANPARSVKVTGMTGITGTATGDITYIDSDTFTVACGGCSGTSATGGTWKANYISQTNNEGNMDFSSAADKIPDVLSGGATCDATHIPRLLSWYYLNDNMPYFAVFYKNSAISTAPVVGIATGQASTFQYNAYGGGPGWYTNTAHFASAGAPAAGITNWGYFAASNSAAGTPVKRQWILHSGGTRADVPAPTEDYARSATLFELNSLGGINLTKIAQYITEYSDPGSGWSEQFMSDAAVANVKAWVKDGTDYCGTVPCLYDILITTPSVSDAAGQSIIKMWKNDTSYYTTLAAGYVDAFLQDWMRNYVEIGGIWQPTFNYTLGGSNFFQRASVANSVLLDSHTTAAQALAMKADLATGAGILWDNDNAPITNNPVTGDGLGTANMPVQMSQYRFGLGILLDFHPYFSQFSAIAKGGILANYSTCVNSSGAIGDAVGYFSTLCAPVLFNFMLMQKHGYISFANYPNWSKMGDFLINLQTHDSRFGSYRKLPAIGDANPTTSELPAMIATAYDGIDDTQSDRLMGGWCLQNSPTTIALQGFFQPSFLAIDLRIPCGTVTRTSATTPGFNSTLLIGTGDNENYVLFINGDFLSDHRSADPGNVVIHVQRTALSTTWGSFYSPKTSGAYSTSGVYANSGLPQAWDADSPSVLAPSSLYGAATVLHFFAGGKCAISEASFAGTVTWTRRVILCAPNTAYPVITVKDSFGSSFASALTWLQMAGTNAVTMPDASSCTPVARNAGTADTPAEYPSTGTSNCAKTYSGAGLQKHQFTGAAWSGTYAPGGGINWDAYMLGVDTTQTVIGNWRVNHTGSRESSEFATVNSRSFDQIEHMWRMSGSGDYQTLFFPRQKGSTAPTVTTETCGTQFVLGGETGCISPTEHSWTDGTVKVLTAFDTTSHAAFNITISGGMQEVTCATSTSCSWKVCDTVASTRTLDLSAFGGTWYTTTPVAITSTNVFTIYHPGGAQPTCYTIALTTTAGTQKSITKYFTSTTATSIAFAVGGQYVSNTAFSSNHAIVPITLTTGSKSLTWDLLDVSGNTLASGSETYVVN